MQQKRAAIEDLDGGTGVGRRAGEVRSSHRERIQPSKPKFIRPKLAERRLSGMATIPRHKDNGCPRRREAKLAKLSRA